MGDCRTYEACGKDNAVPAVFTEVSTDSTTSSSASLHISRPASPINDSLDRNIFDHYIVGKELGSGHYGSVREVVHRASGHLFAAKSIEKSKYKSRELLAREISILQQTDHSGIMKLIDVCEDEHYIHIITEKYDGGELFDQILERGYFPEAECARLIYSLLGTVSYLHEKGICHRDIKPENIMFVTKEEGSAIKLIDFGLARKHDRRSQPPMTNPVGSAYYMSPEVLERRYDLACDLWAIWVVAYILLCGCPPFNGSSDKEIFNSILHGDLRFQSKRWNGVSEDAKDFVRCMLCRDPRARLPADLAMLHPWFLCQNQNVNI